jgi:hypothetical protein
LSFPQRIRDGALEWLICEYEGKEKIKVTNSGNGNFDEFKVKRPPRLSRAPASRHFCAQASLSDDRISFGFFRMISGDQVRMRALADAADARTMMILLQESKRVKFVFYLFVGSSANVMAKVCCDAWHRCLA